MALDFGDIDLSHLDTLAKLEAEQRAVRALSEKAAWHRDKVFEVYSRVIGDYQARLTALDQQASAVRAGVREDLRKLDALYNGCRDATDDARVQLQESEFRREIGEFTREEFLKRQEAAERAIAERQREFDQVRDLRQRYLDLLSAEPVASDTPVQAAESPAPHVPTAQPSGLRAASPAATSTVEPSEAPTTFPTPPPGEQAAPPPARAQAETEPVATIAVVPGLLVEDRRGTAGAQHRLGLLTTIGRTPDNQVVVPIREVSRRHAEIVLTEQGYVVKDLGSPNGTFVNGERIAEHILQHDDRIAMGGKVFVFKAR